MRNKFIIGLLVLPALSLGAQNLDPTVEVTREYEGKLVEVHKPSLEMAVPDSLNRFALDFDYSVFENPYQGSYEFSPYILSMKPSAADTGEGILYLKTGVGYQLHPELDVVWSPRFKSNAFNLDVYALHESFIGNYWKMGLEEVSATESKVVRLPKDKEVRSWFGYDVLTRAGADLRFDAEKFSMNLGTSYYGLARRNFRHKASLNAMDTRFGMSSKPEKKGDLVFDMDVAYRYAEDKYSATSVLKEHLFDFDVYFGPLLKTHHKLDFNVGFNFASYPGQKTNALGEIFVSPRYVYQTDRLSLCLGLNIAKLLGSDDYGLMLGIKDQIVYPNVHFSYVLVKDAMKFHMAAKGGNTLDPYSSIVSRNHQMSYNSMNRLVGNTVERVAVSAGFDGRITSRFSYNLSGGYVNYGSAFLDAVAVAEVPYAVFRYAPYQKWYVAFDWALKLECIRLDGKLAYNSPWGDVFDEGQEDVAVLKPASMTGDIAVEYNWNRRVFGGLDCEFATARRGSWGGTYALTVPGYADLGIYGEYVTSRRLSAWLRVGNLLNMTVQRNPLYAEKGVNFTAGICFNL